MLVPHPATGHYICNILVFLLDNGQATYVLIPLRTNFYRKSFFLRKTKTDRVDARTIAACFCPMRVSSPTRIQHTTMRS